MSYFAAAFARTPQGWVGAEATLDEAEVVDDLTDLMREVAVESIADTVLLLVEEEWFGVVRLEGESDPRAYVSAVRDEGPGGLLQQLLDDVPDGGPVGDPHLLEDFGISADRLAELSERALPGDALLEIAEQAGFGEEYDDLHG